MEDVINGGGPAALNRFSWESSEGERSPALFSKVADVHIGRGQHVRLETPGGGGWGDPLERSPSLVARDVRLGYLSADAARRDYRVALAPDGSVDEAATAGLREGRTAA